MRILLTGATGFVGGRLLARLLARGGIGGGAPSCSQLTVLARRTLALPSGADVRVVTGDMADPAVMARAVEGGVDCVFNLATVPGAAAQRDFDLGMASNIGGLEHLLNALRRQDGRARVVFSSSVGVYGDLPPEVDDGTLPVPNYNYGFQKLMGELMVAAWSHNGWIDGLSVRLCGIVARPEGDSAGLMTGFFSDVIHAARAGKPFTLPMSPQASSWLMSAPCIVDNLLHAARIQSDGFPTSRAFILPALNVSMREYVRAIGELYGPNAAARISFAPVPDIEARFGRQGPIHAAIADRLGFRHDGSTRALIERAMTNLAGTP